MWVFLHTKRQLIFARALMLYSAWTDFCDWSNLLFSLGVNYTSFARSVESKYRQTNENRENLGILSTQFDLHSLWKVNFIVTLLKVQTNLVRHINFFWVFVVGTNKFFISTTFLEDFAWNDRSIWRLFGRISCSCDFCGCCLKMRIYFSLFCALNI